MGKNTNELTRSIAELEREIDGANTDRVAALNRATSAEIRCGELERERDAAYETLEAIAVKGLCLSAVSGAEMPPDWARYRTMSEHVAALRRERDALAAALVETRMVLTWLDWVGGLGIDRHEEIRRVLAMADPQAILAAHDAELTELVLARVMACRPAEHHSSDSDPCARHYQDSLYRHYNEALGDWLFAIQREFAPKEPK